MFRKKRQRDLSRQRQQFTTKLWEKATRIFHFVKSLPSTQRCGRKVQGTSLGVKSGQKESGGRLTVAKPESVHLRDAGNGGGPLPLLLVSSHSLLRHRLLAHHTKPTKKPFTNLHNSMQQANSAAAQKQPAIGCKDQDATEASSGRQSLRALMARSTNSLFCLPLNPTVTFLPIRHFFVCAGDYAFKSPVGRSNVAVRSSEIAVTLLTFPLASVAALRSLIVVSLIQSLLFRNFFQIVFPSACLICLGKRFLHLLNFKFFERSCTNGSQQCLLFPQLPQDLSLRGGQRLFFQTLIQDCRGPFLHGSFSGLVHPFLQCSCGLKFVE